MCNHHLHSNALFFFFVVVVFQRVPEWMIVAMMVVKVVRVCEMDVVRARDLLRSVVRGPPRWHFDERTKNHREHHETRKDDGEYKRRGVDARRRRVVVVLLFRLLGLFFLLRFGRRRRSTTRRHQSVCVFARKNTRRFEVKKMMMSLESN